MNSWRESYRTDETNRRYLSHDWREPCRTEETNRRYLLHEWRKPCRTEEIKRRQEIQAIRHDLDGLNKTFQKLRQNNDKIINLAEKCLEELKRRKEAEIKKKEQVEAENKKEQIEVEIEREELIVAEMKEIEIEAERKEDGTAEDGEQTEKAKGLDSEAKLPKEQMDGMIPISTFNEPTELFVTVHPMQDSRTNPFQEEGNDTNQIETPHNMFHRMRDGGKRRIKKGYMAREVEEVQHQLSTIATKHRIQRYLGATYCQSRTYLPLSKNQYNAPRSSRYAPRTNYERPAFSPRSSNAPRQDRVQAA